MHQHTHKLKQTKRNETKDDRNATIVDNQNKRIMENVHKYEYSLIVNNVMEITQTRTQIEPGMIIVSVYTCHSY